MRRLLCILFLIFAATGVHAQPADGRFVAIGFHDVLDQREALGADSVTTQTLMQFFDWLKGNGWTVVSLDQLAEAARGARPLPDKAILLTFDDGYASLYTRVFPLLRAYRYPATAALVGSWMEVPPGGEVPYGDESRPRGDFISWDQAREMQASGLVEFTSHSYDLHDALQANPQGNVTPAASTWRYDPAVSSYEDDAGQAERIRADLVRSRDVMQARLGRLPRAIVWPYGRYTGADLEIAKGLGFAFAFTLEPEPAAVSDPYRIPRFYPTENPTLSDLVSGLRFAPARPHTRRIACLSLDALAAVGEGAAQDEALGRMIEDVRVLGPDTVVIDANAALPSPGAPLGAVYFPTRLRPMRRDLLGRVTWQVRSRAGAEVFLHLPLGAAVAALGEPDTARLFADMVRFARADGLVLEAPSAAVDAVPVADRPDAVRARRSALDPGKEDPGTRLALAAYGAAAAIDPRLRLMLVMDRPAAPPDWADVGVLPAAKDAKASKTLADRLRAEGWMAPEASGRIALSLPADPKQRAEAIRQAQSKGAAAFAACPALPFEPRSLPAAFSADSYPYKP